MAQQRRRAPSTCSVQQSFPLSVYRTILLFTLTDLIADIQFDTIMRVIKSQNLAIDQHDSMILAAARVLYETSRPTGMAQQCLPGSKNLGSHLETSYFASNTRLGSWRAVGSKAQRSCHSRVLAQVHPSRVGRWPHASPLRRIAEHVHRQQRSG